MASRALVTLLVAGFILAAPAREARAEKKKVVLMNFKGPKAKTIRKQVQALIKSKAKIVSEARFRKAQKKLRARKINDRDVAKVAQNLDVHGVVFGRIKRSRGRYKLNLILRAGSDGAIVEDVTINLGRRPKLTKKAKRDIRRKIAGAISDLEAAEADDAEEEEISDEDTDWEVEDEGGGGGGRGRGRDEVDEEPIADLEKEDDVQKNDEDEPAVALSKQELWDTLGRERAVDLQAGLSVVARTLSFDVDPAIMDRPNGYNGTLVPGAYVQGEVYPLAFDHNKKNKGPLAGLGGAFVVDKVLKISSKLEGGTVDITTTQLRWGVGVRYRINLGDKASGPTVKLGVGYNKLEFSLDQQQIMDNGLDIDLPNVAYTYLDPGIMGRLPFGKEWAGYADARFLVVSDTGDMQLVDNYGSATVSGFDVDVGAEYRLDVRLLVRVGIRFQQIAYSFDGDGTLTDRNGDGAQDVDTATDRYLGGYATAGYLF